MKKVKLYLTYASFWYDCLFCGHKNNIVYSTQGFQTPTSDKLKGSMKHQHVKLVCTQCGTTRKGNMILDQFPPKSKKTEKKLAKLRKKFRKEKVKHEQMQLRKKGKKK